MSRALWSKDGVPYLEPHLQLLYKAKGLRRRDQEDFEVALPLLGDARRVWLADALQRALPGHPWLSTLGGR
ncbi:hypothetical protein [Luteipulveratus mongoliensis]|uniref:hypothetical protein n=1 Tax=Luteipulveratus mongoliensis TaxID=571913 RepID=UPI001FDFAA53|nr:hypothetical protein [Luteipulveratus mongoliensis]